MRVVPTLLLLLCSFSAFSQVVTISKVEIINTKVVVHYDLDDNNLNNEYLLNLYSSKDNFATALTKVSGDVGAEIKPGTGKKIEWNIVEEFGGYKGPLALEVRGRVYVPFLKLQNFNTSRSFKRGKTYNVTWKAGNNFPVNIELYKGGERISGDMNHPNNGSYTLFIPAHSKPGKDYRLKLSDARNTTEVVYTGFFKVVPKVPLWAKVLPVLAVGGAAIAFLGGGDPAPPPPEDNSLPKAPDPD